jgi:outer membrane protein assembly factor BamC
VVTASGYQVGQAAKSLPTASLSIGDVRIERAGSQRWLVVSRPADQLWEPVRDFWQESGFLLSIDQANLGIMETDWAENRAKLPQDFIRNTLGKVLDSFYSTGERDKFRTRLERTPSGATEIFISHRGMIEVVGGNRREGLETAWQPRPADPELEAEFLRRLMVKLGVSQDQSKALLASGAAKSTSRVGMVNNAPVVLIDEGFDRAWRRVGLALDRTGFTVEDRDRNEGTYFVRYVEPNADKKEPGFLGKLFGATTPASAPVKYRIYVRSQGASTTVSVLNATGAPDNSTTAQRIIQVIADDLK